MIRNIFVAITVCAVVGESSTQMITRSQKNANTCGVPKIELGLIINGQNFTRGSFPWIVALMHTRTRPSRFFCAGTLISQTFVVSAAHCFLQKHTTEKFLARDIVALFGAHDLSDYLESGRYQLSPKRIYVHDDWNPRTAEYDADLSILEFEKGFLHFNDFVQPICLWNSENDPTVNDGVVVGWGKSEDATRLHENIPKYVKAPIQSNEECFFSAKALLDLSSRRTFCAGLSNGSGVCRGDSGGGLFIEIEDVFFLKGIVSSSLIKDVGCDVSTNAVYTNVLKFKDWIRGITGVGGIQSVIKFDSNLPASKKVFCEFKMRDTYFYRMLSACQINQLIDSEQYIVGSPRNISIELFRASNNRQINFLPRHIGEKFPNLKQFMADKSGLTVVRDFYFKNMGNLKLLYLNDNQIATIEANAFDDLVSLEWLIFNFNRIQTLDERLFVKLINLKELYFNFNKIKFLSPTMFKITSEGLNYVGLKNNVCIDEAYDSEKKFKRLEFDLGGNCTGS